MPDLIIPGLTRGHDYNVYLVTNTGTTRRVVRAVTETEASRAAAAHFGLPVLKVRKADR